MNQSLKDRTHPRAPEYHPLCSLTGGTGAKNIVIIGGGFAGATLAQHLDGKLPPGYQVLLLSKENYITFNPLLAEAVGASILPSHVVAPLRQMVRRVRVGMVEVSDIDLGRQQLQYLGEGSGVIDYEHLVLACGAVANLQIIPGMAANALPLKTLGDALFLRNRVMARLEHADLQPDPELRRWLLTFIVVGGGFSGVEVAGEIDDCLDSAVRYYRNIDTSDYRVILLHAGDRILPEMSPRLSRFAHRKMERQGIDIRLNVAASRVSDRGVLLDSGETIAAGTVICTVGTAPNPLVHALALPKMRGRVTTHPDMSVPGYTGVWAIGDCAAITNAFDGRSSPPTAQFATRQAEQLADNIVRRIEGRPTRAFHYRPQGQLSSIGHQKAVAEIFGLRFYGFIAWLLWRGLYLLKTPTLSRKARLFFEWSWGMFFPHDIVHLRFTRTPRGGKPVSGAVPSAMSQATPR